MVVWESARLSEWVREGGRGRWNRGERNGNSEERGVSKKTQSSTWIAVIVNIQITSKWISESLCTRGELRSFDYLNVEKYEISGTKMRGKVFSGLKARTDMWQWQTNRDKRIQRTGKYFFFQWSHFSAHVPRNQPTTWRIKNFRWCYTGRIATTTFNGKQCWNVGKMKQPIETKLQKRYTAPAVALKIDVV